jgi:hypothetical protein
MVTPAGTEALSAFEITLTYFLGGMPFNTATLGTAVTPTVLSTLFSHVCPSPPATPMAHR